MKKLLLALTAIAAVLAPAGAQAAPDQQHIGAHSQRIDWD